VAINRTTGHSENHCVVVTAVVVAEGGDTTPQLAVVKTCRL